MIIKRTYTSIKNTLKHNRVLKKYATVLAVFFTVALLAPFLANDRPLMCYYQGQWLFPAFSAKNEVVVSGHVLRYNMGKEWKLLPASFCVFAPCPYSPYSIDAENAPRKGPFDKQVMALKTGEIVPLPLKFRHWLGTTQNGNDVLACLIHGTIISVSVGIVSMLIASVIGIFLGAVAGYYGNTTLKAGIIQLFLSTISLWLIWFYGTISLAPRLSDLFLQNQFTIIITVLASVVFCCVIIFCFNRLGYFIDKLFRIKKTIHIPVDTFVTKTIEILHAVPALLFILTLSAFTKPSFGSLILIIGFLSWAAIARVTRAEYLKAKHLDYVTACKAIGMGNLHIMIKHILPNAWPVLIVQIIFGMAGSVLAEASLSFLGVGVPIETVTWGSLLNEARDHFSSWWLVVCPGFCLFLLIYSYHKIAKELLKTI